jgi:hypothetical protein
MFDIELFAGAGGGCIAHKWLSGRRIGGYVEMCCSCAMCAKGSLGRR